MEWFMNSIEYLTIVSVAAIDTITKYKAGYINVIVEKLIDL